jgi:hypothetical protein
MTGSFKTEADTVSVQDETNRTVVLLASFFQTITKGIVWHIPSACSEKIAMHRPSQQKHASLCHPRMKNLQIELRTSASTWRDDD